MARLGELKQRRINVVAFAQIIILFIWNIRELQLGDAPDDVITVSPSQWQQMLSFCHANSFQGWSWGYLWLEVQGKTMRIINWRLIWARASGTPSPDSGRIESQFHYILPCPTQDRIRPADMGRESGTGGLTLSSFAWQIKFSHTG